jgi:hypothetical protein
VVEFHRNPVVGLSMANLVLKRASRLRPSSEWNDDEYDALAGNFRDGKTLVFR